MLEICSLNCPIYFPFLSFFYIFNKSNGLLIGEDIKDSGEVEEGGMIADEAEAGDVGEQGRGEFRSEVMRDGHKVIWFKCSLFIECP
jgi:hypothetical protein